MRWENHKSGKAGYSPVCANEWVRGICAKPQVKCGQFPHHAFVLVSDEIIARHLRGGGTRSGNFVVDVYPLFADETCRFLLPISTSRTGLRTLPLSVRRADRQTGQHRLLRTGEPDPDIGFVIANVRNHH